VQISRNTTTADSHGQIIFDVELLSINRVIHHLKIALANSFRPKSLKPDLLYIDFTSSEHAYIIQKCILSQYWGAEGLGFDIVIIDDFSRFIRPITKKSAVRVMEKIRKDYIMETIWSGRKESSSSCPLLIIVKLSVAILK